MNSVEATVAVIAVLEELAIPYLLVGSLSTNFYGIARSTRDADFVIELGDQSVATIAARLGPAFRLDPQMSFETVTMTMRHLIDVTEIEFKIELFHLSEDAHDRDRFRRRCHVQFLDRQVSLPTPEDVIVTKLRWAVMSKRSKDRNDVQDVLAVQGSTLDWEYVYHWCDQHGTRALLDEIRQSIPKF